jgi:hypothetical protein
LVSGETGAGALVRSNKAGKVKSLLEDLKKQQESQESTNYDEEFDSFRSEIKSILAPNQVTALEFAEKAG